MQKRMVTIGVAACVLALIVAGLSMAQPPAGGQGGRQRGGNQGDRQDQQGQRGQFDPERMRQMMAQRTKEQFGFDDQTWKVAEPRVMDVMEKRRASMGGGGGMMGFGARGQRPGADGRGGGDRQGPAGQQRELSGVEKAMEQLRAVIAKESASPDEIKKALTTVRAEREKARSELATAQQRLREILTLKQEAIGVEMGILD